METTSLETRLSTWKHNFESGNMISPELNPPSVDEMISGHCHVSKLIQMFPTSYGCFQVNLILSKLIPFIPFKVSW